MIERSPAPTRLAGIALAGLAMLLTGLLYANTIKAGFLWDDAQLPQNLWIQSWKWLPQYFTHHLWAEAAPGSVGNFYRPLNFVWLRIENQFFGFNPVWYHVVTILVAVLGTGLAYLLALGLVGDPITAGVAALLFAVHPVHMECVAWTTGIPDAGLFVVIAGAMLCFLKSGASPQKEWRWLALALFAAALFWKETAIAFPAVIFGYVFFVAGRDLGLRGRTKRALGSSLPFVLLGALYLLARSRVLGGLSHPLVGIPRSEVLFTVPSLCWFYLKHMFLPLGISENYYLDYVKTAASLSFVGPLLVLIACAAILWRWTCKRGGIVAFCAIWFGAFLAPALFGIAAFNWRDLVHDRYLYLPSFAFCLLAAMAFRRFLPSPGAVATPASYGGAVAVGLIVVALACATYAQTPYMIDPYLIALRSAETAPDDPRALFDFGTQLMSRGKPLEALAAYRKSAALAPEWWLPRYVMGRTALQLGQLDDAADGFEQAIAADPTNSEQFFFLARVRLQQGKLSEAEAAARTAILRKPDLPDAHASLGEILLAQGKQGEGLSELQMELEIHPNSAWAQELLNRTLKER